MTMLGQVRKDYFRGEQPLVDQQTIFRVMRDDLDRRLNELAKLSASTGDDYLAALPDMVRFFRSTTELVDKAVAAIRVIGLDEYARRYRQKLAAEIFEVCQSDDLNYIHALAFNGLVLTDADPSCDPETFDSRINIGGLMPDKEHLN
jgi:hypothetical protein